MQHFVTVREAETFQSLNLQSTLEILTRKHHLRQLEGTKAGLRVISWDIKLQGKQNSVRRTKAYCSSCSSGSSALWLFLPKGASSFFLSYFSIHFFPSQKDRMWSGSTNKIINLRFPKPSKHCWSPSDNGQDWRIPLGTPAGTRGEQEMTRPSSSKADRALCLLLRLRELSLFTKLYVENLVFICFPRLMGCDSSCFIYGEMI